MRRRRWGKEEEPRDKLFSKSTSYYLELCIAAWLLRGERAEGWKSFWDIGLIIDTCNANATHITAFKVEE